MDEFKNELTHLDFENKKEHEKIKYDPKVKGFNGLV
jgi:hypothetical protein